MKGYLEQNETPTPDNPVEIETIEIPLQKATYEDIQALNIDLQTKLLVKDKEIERLHSIIKEAREKIHDIYFKIDNIPQNYWIGIKLDVTNQGQELLEILGGDKE